MSEHRGGDNGHDARETIIEDRTSGDGRRKTQEGQMAEYRGAVDGPEAHEHEIPKQGGADDSNKVHEDEVPPIAVPFKHQTMLISIEMSCIQPLS